MTAGLTTSQIAILKVRKSRSDPWGYGPNNPLNTMQLGTLKFSENSGEGSIYLSKDWLGADWVTQADSLQDWIVDLQDLYTQLLETHEPIRELKK